MQLLGGLLEVDPGYVRDVEAMGLATQFFDFLSLEHANNNVHNIRLCRQVVAAGTMPAKQLLELQLSERVAAVVEYAAQNNVEPFLEPVLDLSHTIMAREIEELRAASEGPSATTTTGGGLTAVFLDQAVVFLELCTRVDAAVSRSAAACVLDLVVVFPQQVAPWLLSQESAAILVAVLEGEGAPTALQQLLLEALLHAVSEPDCVLEPGGAAELAKLREAVQHIAMSGDVSVRALAGQLVTSLGTFL